jgi:hypothetical protein
MRFTGFTGIYVFQSAHGQIITPDLAGNIIGDCLYSPRSLG